MTNVDTDLTALAAQLKQQSERLAREARDAEHDVKILEAEPKPEADLDPDFAEKLESSLSEPRQKLQKIAKLAR
jgi:hypothetical protein